MMLIIVVMSIIINIIPYCSKAWR